MKTYELTYIISSQITSDQIDNAVKDVESFIRDKEGLILRSEKTTAQTLAYPIKKQSSGYFVILEFQISEPARSATGVAGGDKIKEIKEKLEKDNKILRHFIIVKKPIKETKKMRTRKPLTTPKHEPKERSDNIEAFGDKYKKKEGKVESLDEIEKKLDEILSE